jgi:hypothetical protein
MQVQPGFTTASPRRRSLHPIMPGLDVNEHMRFQRQEWRVERIGWVCVWGFMAAGLAGLVGRGPISSTKVESGAVTLEYHRLTHITQPEELKLRLRPKGDGGAELLISGPFLHAVEITGITPEPSEQEARPGGAIALTFERSGDARDFGVTIDYEIVEAGRHKGRVEHAGDAVEFATFAYP